MKKKILPSLFWLLAAAVSVLAQKDFCFENRGLQTVQTVRMILINNRKIEGVFETGSGDVSSPLKTINFNGTKTGNRLTIIFDGGKSPYEAARGTKKIVWTLGANSLKISIYSKNYQTHKYSISPAIFDRCKNE